jgi:hypothetical protein
MHLGIWFWREAAETVDWAVRWAGKWPRKRWLPWAMPICGFADEAANAPSAFVASVAGVWGRKVPIPRRDLVRLGETGGRIIGTESSLPVRRAKIVSLFKSTGSFFSSYCGIFRASLVPKGWEL